VACAALALLPRAAAQPGSLVSVEQVYGSLLVAPVHYDVTGYLAMDRFAPLKHAEARRRERAHAALQRSCCAASQLLPPRAAAGACSRASCGAAARRWRSR
jgi:hypothetical protein